MRDGEITMFGYLVLVGLACLFLVAVYSARLPEQRFGSHDAFMMCGTVCEVKHGSRWCSTPCPGPRCLCVLGVDDEGREVWRVDHTIGDEQ